MVVGCSADGDGGGVKDVKVDESVQGLAPGSKASRKIPRSLLGSHLVNIATPSSHIINSIAFFHPKLARDHATETTILPPCAILDFFSFFARRHANWELQCLHGGHHANPKGRNMTAILI
jgi:hypothetical protein